MPNEKEMRERISAVAYKALAMEYLKGKPSHIVVTRAIQEALEDQADFESHSFFVHNVDFEGDRLVYDVAVNPVKLFINPVHQALDEAPEEVPDETQ